MLKLSREAVLFAAGSVLGLLVDAVVVQALVSLLGWKSLPGARAVVPAGGHAHPVAEPAAAPSPSAAAAAPPTPNGCTGWA
ncbi:MAG TPA: hypothetical protein VIO59_01675 [Rhodanobacter sp.]